MKTDEEIRRSFKVYLDEDGILNLVFFAPEYDDNNTKQAELVRDDCLKILNADKDKIYNALVDLTPIGTTGAVSTGGGHIYNELARNSQFGKVAIIGVSETENRVLTFVLSMMKFLNRRMSWFPNKEEALMWFNEK